MAACREARPLVDDGLPASIRTDKLGRARGQLRCGGVHRQIDQVAHNLVERAPECGRVASEPASNDTPQRLKAPQLLAAGDQSHELQPLPVGRCPGVYA